MTVDPSLATEFSNHTNGLTMIVGIMGLIIGALLMAAYNYFQKRMAKVEDRQDRLREEVLPTLITKSDLRVVVETLEKIGNAFVDRVEKFMTACHSGECSMALYIKGMVPIPEHKQPKTPTRKEGA